MVVLVQKNNNITVRQVQRPYAPYKDRKYMQSLFVFILISSSCLHFVVVYIVQKYGNWLAIILSESDALLFYLFWSEEPILYYMKLHYTTHTYNILLVR